MSDIEERLHKLFIKHINHKNHETQAAAVEEGTLKYVIDYFIFVKIYYFLLKNPLFLYKGNEGENENEKIKTKLVTFVLGIQDPSDLTLKACDTLKEIFDARLTQTALKLNTKHHFIRFDSKKYDILDLFRNIEYPEEDFESFSKDKKLEGNELKIYNIMKKIIDTH